MLKHHSEKEIKYFKKTLQKHLTFLFYCDIVYIANKKRNVKYGGSKLNRAKRRKLYQENNHLPKKTIDKLITFHELIETAKEKASQFKVGDTVELNLSKIKSYKDYPRMVKDYKDWVQENATKQFKIKEIRKFVHSPVSVVLEDFNCIEQPWIFWVGDLKRKELYE